MEQQTKEWLRLRKNYIGSSDAPIIAGVSPWKTPYQLWEEKLNPIVHTEKSPFMHRGLELEPIARQVFEREMLVSVEPKVIFSENIDWQMASLDGIDSTGKIVVEIKCPGKEDHESAMDGIIPSHYMPQLYHQMCVANVKSMYYLSYTELSFKILEVERVDAFLDALLLKEELFWKSIVNFDPPPLSDRDYVVKEDSAWQALAEEWRACKMQLKAYEDIEKSLRNQLIEMAEGKSAKGCGISLSKYSTKGHVDYSQIPELKGVNLDTYRKPPSTAWRISSVN